MEPPDIKEQQYQANICIFINKKKKSNKQWKRYSKNNRLEKIEYTVSKRRLRVNILFLLHQVNYLDTKIS